MLSTARQAASCHVVVLPRRQCARAQHNGSAVVYAACCKANVIGCSSTARQHGRHTCVMKGCCSSCSAVGLLLGSFCRHCLMKSRRSSPSTPGAGRGTSSSQICSGAQQERSQPCKGLLHQLHGIRQSTACCTHCQSPWAAIQHEEPEAAMRATWLPELDILCYSRAPSAALGLPLPRMGKCLWHTPAVPGPSSCKQDKCEVCNDQHTKTSS